MPPAARLGDSCTGHDSWPPRGNNQGSPNVTINGRPAHRQGDSFPVHCNPTPQCHGAVLAGGSSTVTVNGKPAGRIGDAVSCGGTVTEGSENVIIGG